MIIGEEILRKMYPDLDEEQYQPAGIDLTLGQLKAFDDSEEVYGICNNVKQLPKYKNVPESAVSIDEQNEKLDIGWLLEPHVPYIGVTKEMIQIDSNMAQIYLPRSSLLRGGVLVETALGDPGFHGHLSFLMLNQLHKPFFISKNERFAQMINLKVDGVITDYDGDYNE